VSLRTKRPSSMEDVMIVLLAKYGYDYGCEEREREREK
jgi:hypothetical protein